MEDFEETLEEETLEEEGLQDAGGFESARDILNEGVGDPPQEMGTPVPFSPDVHFPSPGLGTEPVEEEGPGSTEDGEEDESEAEDGKERDTDDHPAILRIDEALLARVNEVFVEPSGYSQSEQERLELIIESHVFILYGDEHAGKGSQRNNIGTLLRDYGILMPE